MIEKSRLKSDILWYKDALIYQLNVKSFKDSNGDGIGDFPGLTQQLGYLEDLGVTAVWLLPFYLSPLRDDGYDISDYMGIHPSYGTLKDFRQFLREAHKRGLKIITELVINHTSDQHLWFKRAKRSSPGSPERDYYVWSDTPDRYKKARIIFKDFESSNWTWDPVAKAYYWHRFYSHQPDLNFENPLVHREIFSIIDFWMGMGVDGMRLDAVPYLYEKEGTMCENLPETYNFLRKLRSYIDENYENRILLAEANQWPEDSTAYFGSGNICHMAFHFPLMPRMFMALQMEDWFPLVDILEQTPQIPDSCQWAIFLRNHDELTLEMVTDEERDYMYRYYAHDQSARINLGIRRRLAPLLRNSRRRMEIMNILLLSLPGTPIIYYGDEIGMGDNHYLGDRNGVRTPMQWNADRNAGFSTANPHKLFLPVIIDSEYHFEALNVETQQQNTSSMLWWMKRIIAMRKKYKAFARGDLEFIKSDNASILTFVRNYGDEIILIAVNLSRFSQSVSLDLSKYAGYVPKDIFSDNHFPQIQETPYILTMGFHDYFWLYLEKVESLESHRTSFEIPELCVNNVWTGLFEGTNRDMIEEHILPGFLQVRKTAGCRKLPVKETRILDLIKINGETDIVILIISITYIQGISDTVMLPLSVCSCEMIKEAVRGNTGMIMARLTGTVEGFLYDCAFSSKLHTAFLKLMSTPRKLNGHQGVIEGYSGVMLPRGLRKFVPFGVNILKSGALSTSFQYGTDFHFRLYRRLEEGIRTDVEVGQFLSEQAVLTPSPLFMGAVQYRKGAQISVLGVMNSFVKNTGTAWNLALDSAIKFLEEILSKGLNENSGNDVNELNGLFTTKNSSSIALGAFTDMVQKIGIKTAKMHFAFLLVDDNTDFEPEAFTRLYQRSLYQSMRTKARRVISSFRRQINQLPLHLSEYAKPVISNEQRILDIFGTILNMDLSILKTRIHGNCHLNQFLNIGNDFVIKDFRGPSGSALSERRLKRSPLRDVAGIVNSFHKAVATALYQSLAVSSTSVKSLEKWADIWFLQAVTVFLKAYDTTFSLESRQPFDLTKIPGLLRNYFLEQGLTDLETELENPADNLIIAARAVKTALDNNIAEKLNLN